MRKFIAITILVAAVGLAAIKYIDTRPEAIINDASPIERIIKPKKPDTTTQIGI